jgi:hypothetical protein
MNMINLLDVAPIHGHYHHHVRPPRPIIDEPVKVIEDSVSNATDTVEEVIDTVATQTDTLTSMLPTATDTAAGGSSTLWWAVFAVFVVLSLCLAFALTYRKRLA